MAVFCGQPTLEVWFSKHLSSLDYYEKKNVLTICFTWSVHKRLVDSAGDCELHPTLPMARQLFSGFSVVRGSGTTYVQLFYEMGKCADAYIAICHQR